MCVAGEQALGGEQCPHPSHQPLQQLCSRICAASPLPRSGFACVAHCFQNEITLSHGKNKSPQLYRQISLKVFKEDLQGSSLVDDIGNKYEHQYLRLF